MFVFVSIDGPRVRSKAGLLLLEDGWTISDLHNVIQRLRAATGRRRVSILRGSNVFPEPNDGLLARSAVGEFCIGA